MVYGDNHFPFYKKLYTILFYNKLLPRILKRLHTLITVMSNYSENYTNFLIVRYNLNSRDRKIKKNDTDLATSMSKNHQEVFDITKKGITLLWSIF